MSMATASYLFPTPSAAMIRTGDFPSSSICSAPMATAPFPSPFFSPTTTPMYAPTSAFPPPPFFFGASPHSPYPAYTPPPAPAYAPLPLFPYPPPAQAPPPESTAPPSPTPASVFHPAPAYNSSPTFPTTTSVSKMQPDPDPSSVGFGSSPSSSTTLPSIPTSKVTRGGAPADRTLMKLHAYEGSKSEENASATPRKVCTLQTEKSGSDILTHLAPQHKPQRHGAALTRRLLHDLSRRLDEHYAQSQHSLESLQGELSKLSTSISQFAVALGRQTIEASVVTGSFPAAASVQFRSPATTASRLSDTSAAATSSASSGSSPVGAPSTVFVAPQVFGEIPTPIFLQETHGTAPGHHNPIQHSYGTERSYFALPENYPLERVVPEQMFAVYDESDGCSNEFVQVFSDTPEQQTYEVEQDEGNQVPQCFTKPAFSPERPTVGAVGVNKALADAFSQDATDFTSMLVPCLFADRPIECSVRNLKTDLHSLPEYVLSYRHGEPQQVWDPGASAVIVIPPKNNSSNYFFSHDKADLWSQSEHQCIVLRVVFEEVMLDKPPAKPPDRFRIALFPDISRGDIENIGIFVKLPWSIISAQHFQDFSRQMCSTFSTGCILLWNPWYAILFLHQFLWEFSVKQGTQMPWDPGHATVAMTCEHATTGKRIICMEMHCGSTTVQVTEQRLVLEFSLMAAMLRNGIEFRDGQLLYMSQGTSYTSPGCITKRTSTTSSAITACTISFMIDQWEFLHQLGVKKYCSEKNLLSSPNYLQLLELDIIFITFLPP